MEVSPSTVMQLNDFSFAADTSACSTGAGIAASVNTNASMVAISGAIMPLPLANPLMVTWTPPIEAVRVHPFGKVSVVMIALAAGSHRRLIGRHARPGRFDSDGVGRDQPAADDASRGHEHLARLNSASSAAAFTVASTKASPALPVKALELPELTTMARATLPPRLARQR